MNEFDERSTANSDFAKFLLKRGEILDSWAQTAYRFFIGSREHFRRLAIRRQLAEHFNIDPNTLTEIHAQKRLWTMIAKRCSSPTDNSTNWTNGTTDAPIAKLEDSCISLKISPTGVESVKASRYAFARLLLFINYYPWTTLVEDDSELNRRIRRRIKYHPKYLKRLYTPGTFINQTIFDWLIIQFPEIKFPIDQLGKIILDIENQGLELGKWDNPYSIAKYILYYRFANRESTPSAWMWDRTSDWGQQFLEDPT